MTRATLRNDSGDTPLHALIKYGIDTDTSAVLRHVKNKAVSLLSARIDVSIPNVEGKTALDLLREQEVPRSKRGAKSYRALIALLSSAEECSICLNTEMSRSVRLLLSCNHLFHAWCVEKWFTHQRRLRQEWGNEDNQNTCPSCCAAVTNTIPV